MANSHTINIDLDKELCAEIMRLRLALCQIIAYPHLNAVEEATRALTLPGKSISERGKNWLLFADQVFHHVEDYTVPQYGDKGQDQVTEWTGDDCAKQPGKYLSRRNRNARPGQELRDMLKAAHYVQLTEEKDRESRRFIPPPISLVDDDNQYPPMTVNGEVLRCVRCGAAYHPRYPHVCKVEG